jgi:hypothetical protein
MTEAERAASILSKEVDLHEPFDKKWKVNALELVMKNLVPIAACKELGLRAIDDPEKRKLVATYVGPENGNGHEHYGFNVWLLNECSGRAGGEHIFMRCLNCHKIRTSKRIDTGPCKCGGVKMSNLTGTLDTRKALGYYASGY